MSGKLVGEVVEWLLTPAADGLTTAERAALMVVAERAHEQTREMWRHRGDEISLYDRIAIAIGTPSGMKKVFRRLAERGLEIRIPIGKGHDGRPVYAAHGRPARFRLPELPVLPGRGRGDEEPPFPAEEPVDNSGDPDLKGGPGDPLQVSRGDEEPPFAEGRGDREPPFGPRRGDEEPPLIPYKENPYREDHLPEDQNLPLPVLAVGERTVRTARATATAPPAQPEDQFLARSLIAAIPRYRTAPGWAKKHLAALTAAALTAGLGRDAITTYAQLVIAERTYADHQHIPELRAALNRLARDVAQGDACPTCAKDPGGSFCCPTDRPWTPEDQAALDAALNLLGVTDDLHQETS